MQHGIRPSQFPVLNIVMGPFGVGKSEMLRKKFVDPEQLYISDPDSIRPYLLPGYDPSNHSHVLRTSREVSDISDAGLYTALTKRLSVLCETSLRNLDWWQRIVNHVTRIGYRVELHMATRPLHDCFRRVIATRDRPARVGDYLDLKNRYSNFLSLINNSGVRTVTVTGMHSADGMSAEDCPLTGEHVRAIQRHPKVLGD